MGEDHEEFERFVSKVEPGLRRALVAGFGAVEGRLATVDALAWAWEHWCDVASMTNPAGYLYRVGRTAATRSRPRDLPVAELVPDHVSDRLDIEPGLVPGLASLSHQQRAAVLLVHGYGYSLRDAASLLDISPSTVHTDCKRALARLRTVLEVEQDVS
jgi:DNA-directed RNA polymerase specialized sigma24 family protein